MWPLLERSIIGSYHKVSIKDLPAYLDELEFRFNGRENPFLFQDTLPVMLEAMRCRTGLPLGARMLPSRRRSTVTLS